MSTLLDRRLTVQAPGALVNDLKNDVHHDLPFLLPLTLSRICQWYDLPSAIARL